MWCVMRTGGTVERVDPLSLTKDFASILENPIIASQVRIVLGCLLCCAVCIWERQRERETEEGFFPSVFVIWYNIMLCWTVLLYWLYYSYKFHYYLSGSTGVPIAWWTQFPKRRRRYTHTHTGCRKCHRRYVCVFMHVCVCVCLCVRFVGTYIWLILCWECVVSWGVRCV